MSRTQSNACDTPGTNDFVQAPAIQACHHAAGLIMFISVEHPPTLIIRLFPKCDHKKASLARSTP
jgi:hypothetical protein